MTDAINRRDPDGVSDMATKVDGATPRQMLVKWANEQDAWIRRIAAEVLNAKQPLTSEQIGAVYAEFLIEKGLDEGDSVEVPNLEDAEDAVQTEERLELVSLSAVAGVNALADDQTVEFDDCITILFGENGSGKTGYARILKRLAAVRTAEEILPDINATGTMVPPSANLKIKIGETFESMHWSNETGLPPFTRISVFDAPAVTIHVDNELNYVYTPAELALFSQIGDAVRGVQTAAEDEASELRATGNPFLSQFTRGSKVYPLVETLGDTSDLTELTELGKLSADERTRRAALETEISALRGSGLGAMQSTAKDLAGRLAHAIEFLELIESFNFAAYETARQALTRVRESRRKARDELFTAGELAGAADDSWQSFVSEGEHYRAHLGLEEYPRDGDRCLYCRQELSSDAIALVRRYRDFLEDALAAETQQAEQAARTLALLPGSVSFSVIRADIETLAGHEPAPAFVRELQTLLEQSQTTVELTGSLVETPNDNLAPRAAALLVDVRGAHASAVARAEELEIQIADSAAALRTRQAEFAELDARLILEQILPAVRTFVTSAKRGSRLSKLARSLSSSVLRQLTELSKLASEDLVNQDFERLFREECEALRAPSVALEFQGRRGKAERKKAVANYKPSSVLSEGEQKVLALADFLAEGRMGAANAPIIFDDPVTSLDYRRMGEVANRISLLGETHQVVVFTHNIMFASSLLALRTGKKLRCKFYEICDEGLTKGIVQPAAEPRSDTCADFETQINKLLETMKSAEPVVRDALLSSSYGLLRSWCEAFVEQEMLQNVSQRYRVNVMMGNIAKIKADRLAATTAALIPIFDRCSRFMPGHSQPLEQLNVQPKLDEFERDYSAAKALRAAYSK